MRFLFAYIKNKQYLCTAFSVREAGEIPAQSRCCDSQSNVKFYKSLVLSELGRLNKGAISQKTCCMPSTTRLMS